MWSLLYSTLDQLHLHYEGSSIASILSKFFSPNHSAKHSSLGVTDSITTCVSSPIHSLVPLVRLVPTIVMTMALCYLMAHQGHLKMCMVFVLKPFSNQPETGLSLCNSTAVSCSIPDLHQCKCNQN